jgi:Fe-S-cluster containining protein
VTVPSSARDRLLNLFAKVDAFFEQAALRFPGPSGITCHAGCADCCRRFSVTALEAEVIAEGLARLPAATRSALAARAAQPTDACPALDPDGRCAIYAFRPVLCRTHGLPIRFELHGQAAQSGDTPNPAAPERIERRALPVVDACPRNFGGRDLATLPRDAVLDQTTLSIMLAALDAAWSAETGRPRGERVTVATVLGLT